MVIYHTIREMEKIKPYEPEPGFLPAETLEELNEKVKGLGLGDISFAGYNDKQALEIGNQTAEHIDGLFRKFPKLNEELKEEQKLKKLWITKKVYLDEIGALGRYYSGESAIDIGGMAYKSHELHIGGKFFGIGHDYFSNLRHEYGHHFMSKVGPLGIKKEFMDMYIKLGGKEYFEKNVSKYAGANFLEGFAECFSAYTSPKYKKGMLPKEIEEYFDDLIGK